MISAKTQSDVNAAINLKDFALAGTLADAAVNRGEEHEILFTLAAQKRLEAGDPRGAVDLYLRAVEVAPDNPEILAAAGDALRCTGQLKEAVALFDRSIACQPSTVAAWYGRALALEAEGALFEAQLSFTHVTELAPSVAVGFAGLASMQAVRGDLAEARKNAQRAYALNPSESGALIALARCEIADGKYQSAVGWLQATLRLANIAVADELLALGLLGDSLGKLDFANESFDAYSRANRLFSDIYDSDDSKLAALHAIEAIDAGVAKLQKSEAESSTSHVPTGFKSHIFLLGYPRSGTTLAEQILATIPDVVTLEEAPTLAASERFLTKDGMAAFAALSNDEITMLRNEYWSAVERGGVEVIGKTFVDMDPLKGSALPLIARLFPDAKIVIMHRDPRDVVWSCFKHNFIYSQTTTEFTTLERAANHYHALMSLVSRSIRTLDLTVYILSYEKLVDDFDQTTGALCSFLGLPWSVSLRDFSVTANSRNVRTASGPQVRRSLYDGTGQWQKYAQQMETIAPILERWIDPSALRLVTLL
jgi:tetratricopeptide (TPR) repeat protein